MPTVLSDQGVIEYEEIGEGEPLILIHGVGLDHTMWKQQVENLSKQFRVIAYDMLGHGGSSHPPGPYTLSMFVEQLLSLADQLQLKTFHLIGFSMGGMVAQSIALSYPNKVKTLTILNSVANRTEKQRQAVLSRVNEAENASPSATIEPAIKRWFTEEFLINETQVVDCIRTRLKTNNPSSYLAAYRLFATADQELWLELQRITQPTLIITGEDDIGSSPQMAMEMHGEINGSEVVIIPKMKHMLPVENAEAVNEIIKAFIKKQMISLG